MKKKILRHVISINLLFLFTLSSCIGPKLNYSFDTGKSIDFSKGKWLINEVNTNKPYLNSQLSGNAFEAFYKIIGDSLYDINRVRINHFIDHKIKHDLNKDQLIKLGLESDCDFLIEIKADILTDNVDPMNYPSQIDVTKTNSSLVTVEIYDLNHGLLISSASVDARLEISRDLTPETDQYGFEKGDGIPMFYRGATFGLKKSIKKIAQKYQKYSIKK